MDLGRDTDLRGLDTEVSTAAPIPCAIASSLAKRSLDLFAGLLLLLFVLPLLVLTALCIVLDSRGSVFFTQRRTGRGGQTFRVYKFRTMRVMEDGEHVRHAVRDDDRVTRVGRFLRRSSIDELPQLLNVIKGDMSLVGPRPHALAHDQYYGALVPHYARRFRARPGITGLAQVNGLRGEIHSLDSMVDRIALDNAYIESWSLALDLKILVKTAKVAAFQPTAY